MKRKRRGLVAHGRGGTQAPTGYTYTRKGMAAAILLGIIQSYTIAMTLRVGYEQRRRRDSFYVVFAFEIGLWADAACVCFERSFEGAAPLTVAAPT